MGGKNVQLQKGASGLRFFHRGEVQFVRQANYQEGIGKEGGEQNNGESPRSKRAERVIIRLTPVSFRTVQNRFYKGQCTGRWTVKDEIWGKNFSEGVLPPGTRLESSTSRMTMTGRVGEREPEE